MSGTPISELDVHCFDGEFYDLTRRYLEKQGCIWAEQRTGDQLEAIHLTFPPGTMRKELPPDGVFDRSQVLFEKGGVLFVSIRRLSGENSINVPYVLL
jgi:hypothetical protein